MPGSVQRAPAGALQAARSRTISRGRHPASMRRECAMRIRPQSGCASFRMSTATGSHLQAFPGGPWLACWPAAPRGAARSRQGRASRHRCLLPGCFDIRPPAGTPYAPIQSDTPQWSIGTAAMYRKTRPTACLLLSGSPWRQNGETMRGCRCEAFAWHLHSPICHQAGIEKRYSRPTPALSAVKRFPAALRAWIRPAVRCSAVRSFRT